MRTEVSIVTYTCDRCGYEQRQGDAGSGRWEKFVAQNLYHPDKSSVSIHDLCPDCVEDFALFIADGPTPVSPQETT